MGQRACHAAELTFDNCFIPTENRVGVEGAAVFATALVLACSRGPVGAIATGIARAAYERTVAYCKRRRTIGGTLLERQWVRLALADMAADVQRSRGAYLQAADFFDRHVLEPLFGLRPLANSVFQVFAPLRRSAVGRRLMASEAFKRQTYRWVRGRTASVLAHALGFSSMAKFSCADAAVRCCIRALEILGPDGGDEAQGIAKLLREAKLTQIYEGTNQLNRLAFGQALFDESWPC